MNTEINKPWINPKEFEIMFGMSESTQAKKRSAGKLPYSKFGGFVFYKVELIYELLEDHLVG
jgi:hypothetical protein